MSLKGRPFEKIALFAKKVFTVAAKTAMVGWSDGRKKF